jgi:hypothetical protein
MVLSPFGNSFCLPRQSLNSSPSAYGNHLPYAYLQTTDLSNTNLSSLHFFDAILYRSLPGGPVRPPAAAKFFLAYPAFITG